MWTWADEEVLDEGLLRAELIRGDSSWIVSSVVAYREAGMSTLISHVTSVFKIR